MPPPPPPRPDRVRLRQILVAYEGAKQSSATRTKDEARQLAEKLQSELRATPAEFARLAARHSDDPSGPLGGDLGVVREGDLVAELESAAFALSPGEVSDVVETPCGFHVLMRVD
ncbi:MAG: peptidylprolyl isomerase [Planctomycetes bacterium]|nr:peptidylprolyl isomerase [Planctomycetota bacterium]